MKCYRTDCNEECNDLKEKYCLFRITESQQRVIAQIKGTNCINCGSKYITAKYKGMKTRLCTHCGIVANDIRVIKKCLVNSRRAG